MFYISAVINNASVQAYANENNDKKKQWCKMHEKVTANHNPQMLIILFYSFGKQILLFLILYKMHAFTHSLSLFKYFKIVS